MIQNKRNCAIFRSQSPNLMRSLSKASVTIVDQLNYSRQEENLNSNLMEEVQPISTQWQPPPANTIRVNCDVAFKDHCAVIGFIARNDYGALIHRDLKKLSCSSSLAAEVEAFQMAVEQASSVETLNSKQRWIVKSCFSSLRILLTMTSLLKPLFCIFLI